jgi:ankyrin repeat protein
MNFEEARRGLMAGDFSRLAPLFQAPADGGPCPIIEWYGAGVFAPAPEALAEAFTCACFNNCTDVIEHLLAHGVDPNGGTATGLDALHWAANRGQLKAVEMLLRNKAALETQNGYGGTVLGCAVWSAVHEPRPDHLRIIELLLEAGARGGAVDQPSGNEHVDRLLERYRVRE